MTSSAEAAHDAEVPGVPDSDKADVIYDRYVDAQAAKQTIFNSLVLELLTGLSRGQSSPTTTAEVLDLLHVPGLHLIEQTEMILSIHKSAFLAKLDCIKVRKPLRSLAETCSSLYMFH